MGECVQGPGGPVLQDRPCLQQTRAIAVGSWRCADQVNRRASIDKVSL